MHLNLYTIQAIHIQGVHVRCQALFQFREAYIAFTDNAIACYQPQKVCKQGSATKGTLNIVGREGQKCPSGLLTTAPGSIPGA